jgi:hypothetical protein
MILQANAPTIHIANSSESFSAIIIVGVTVSSKINHRKKSHNIASGKIVN